MSGRRPTDSAAPQATADWHRDQSQSRGRLSAEQLSPRDIMETYGHRVEEIEFRTLVGHGRGEIATRFRLRPEHKPAEDPA